MLSKVDEPENDDQTSSIRGSAKAVPPSIDVIDASPSSFRVPAQARGKFSHHLRDFVKFSLPRVFRPNFNDDAKLTRRSVILESVD